MPIICNRRRWALIGFPKPRRRPSTGLDGARSAGDQSPLYIVMGGTIRFPNDRRAQRGRAAHWEPFTWSDFSRNSFPPTPRAGSRVLQLVWQAAGQAMFYFLGVLSPGRATIDLKPACLLYEQGIDPAQVDYREEEKSRAEAYRPANAQRLTAHPRRVVRPSPEHHEPLRDTMLAAAQCDAHHPAQQKNGKRVVFGISRVLISCNLRTRRSVQTNLVGIPDAWTCSTQFSWNIPGTRGSVRAKDNLHKEKYDHQHHRP